jgi:hypothetical protein
MTTIQDRKPSPSTDRPGRLPARWPALLPTLALVLLVSPFLWSCGAPSEKELSEARKEIRATLMEYLPKMAEAYRTGDVTPLEGYTTQKERAILKKHIADLEKQGLTMDTKLLNLTIEDLNLVNYADAYVTTVEDWHVTTYAVGTDRVVGEDPRQNSRVRYQLQRKRDHWTILARNRDPSLNKD